MRAYIVASVITLCSLFIFAFLFVDKNINSSANVNPQVLAETVELSPMESLFVGKINEIRKQVGTQPVIYDYGINKLTDFRTQDMIEREYYSHKTPDKMIFSDYFKEFGIDSEFSCENLQLQQGADINEAINSWKNSSSHFKCLVDPRVKSIALTAMKYDNPNDYADSEATFVFTMIATD